MLWLTLLAVTKLAVASLQFQEQKLSIDGRIMWAYAEDFNGDGRADLVVAFRRGYEPSTKRYVAWFEQQANGQFATTASAERAIPEDVAFAQVVDLSGAGRASLLLVSGTGVSAFSYKKDQPSETPEVLIQTPTATPFADNESLPLWDFARPWHDEKNIQIAIWRVGEIQFYSRGADGSFAATETLSLRPLTRVNSRQNGVFYGQYSNRNLSISVSHVFPELVTGDYDGDGQRDLFALDEDHLQIFLGKNGKFSNQANVVLDFAMRSQQEKQNDTAFISGRVVDLDGDGRCDYIANKVSGGLSSMRSETHIHLNHGGFKKTPDQVIKRDGFASMVTLVDIDGDGKPELIEPHADVGLLTLARAMISKKITVDWLISTNKNGQFDTANAVKLPIVFGLDFSGGGMFKGPFPRFDLDYDGDGRPDFVSSADGSELSFYLGQADHFFATEPAVTVETEASPYTQPFFDPASRKVNFVTFFRDMSGRQGKIVVLWNR